MSIRLTRVALYGGVVGAVVGLSKAHAVLNQYDYTGSFRFAWSIAYIVLLVLAAYGTGLPEDVRTANGALRSSVASVGVAAIAISLVQLGTGDALLPRFVVFGSAGLLAPWFWLCSAVALNGKARAELNERVLLIGDGVDLSALEAELDSAPEKPVQLIGVVRVQEARPTGAGDEPVADLAARERVSVLVLAHDAQGDESVVAQAACLHERGVRVWTLIRFYEECFGKLPVSELERLSLMFDISELHRNGYGRLKRLFDLVVAIPGTLLFLAVVPLVFLTNLVGNRGPLFYRQARVGRNGAVFEILKFRTMRPGSEDDPSEWTCEEDPRITPVGRVLRITHLDEVPQMLNILRGDLSIVGPRPEQPQYVAELAEKLPFYNLRHLVKPGLTGWAQVKYGYAGSESGALEKLQYDFYYLRHQRLAFELRVLGRTVRTVLARRGR